MPRYNAAVHLSRGRTMSNRLPNGPVMRQGGPLVTIGFEFCSGLLITPGMSTRLPLFSKCRSKMHTLCEGRTEEENSATLWSHLPLFWRFQLAGWAVFVPLTFPLK